MKVARWGVAMAFATVGGPHGRVVSHVFVHDSRMPICKPVLKYTTVEETGRPDELADGGTHHCHACHRLLVFAYWSITSFEKQVLWVVSIPSLRPEEPRPLTAADWEARLRDVHKPQRPHAEGIAKDQAEAMAGDAPAEAISPRGVLEADELGLSVPCTIADVKRAFRRKAKETHPDNGGSDDAFRRVKSAYDAAAKDLGASA